LHILRKYIKRYLTEATTTKFFWLAFNMPVEPYNDQTKNVFNELRSLKMHGVRGISNNSDNVRDWINVRDAFLVMDTEEVMKANPGLEPVEYDNPDKMLANGMNHLKRIWNQSGKYAFSQVLLRLFEHSFTGKDQPLREPASVGDNIGRSLEKLGETSDVIKSIDDLVAATFRGAEASAASADHWTKYRRDETLETLKSIGPEGLKQWFQKGFDRIAEIYGTEGEWVVADDQPFVIPPNSRLIVPDHVKEKASREKSASSPFASKYDQSWLDALPVWQKNVESLKSVLNVVDYDQINAKNRAVNMLQLRKSSRPVEVHRYTTKDGKIVKGYTRKFPVKDNK
jgi:hypothetical protein